MTFAKLAFLISQTQSNSLLAANESKTNLLDRRRAVPGRSETLVLMLIVLIKLGATYWKLTSNLDGELNQGALEVLLDILTFLLLLQVQNSKNLVIN